MKIVLEIPDDQIDNLGDCATALQARLIYQGWSLEAVLVNLLSRAAHSKETLAVPATEDLSRRARERNLHTGELISARRIE